jgi:single-strand DNA-binding protein
MANFNKVILCGYLTRDPEMRYTPKGTAVCGCALAVNRSWRNEAGEEMSEVTFVEFSAWGKQAENLSQYLRKGSPLLFEGRLRTESWDDKQTGQKRSKMVVVLESFQFLNDGKPREDGGGEPRRQHRETTQPRQDEPQRTRDSAYQPDAMDDVPF